MMRRAISRKELIMFYPMFAMVLLTLVVGVYLLSLRVRAVKRREVSIGYFRLYSGQTEPPARLLAASNHFNNLFQIPLLFYITCLMTLQTGLTGPLMQTLAWLFVASRVAHALIHLTYNNVIHRMLAFWFGLLLVVAMWVVMFLHFSSAG